MVKLNRQSDFWSLIGKHNIVEKEVSILGGTGEMLRAVEEKYDQQWTSGEHRLARV